MFVSIQFKIAGVMTLFMAVAVVVMNARFYATREFTFKTTAGHLRTGTFFFEWDNSTSATPTTPELQVNFEVKNNKSVVNYYDGSVFLEKKNYWSGPWVKATEGPKKDGLTIISGSPRSRGTEAKGVNAENRASIVTQAINLLNEVMPKDTTMAKDLSAVRPKDTMSDGTASGA